MSRIKVEKYIDDYAIKTGEIYIAVLGGICARGKTEIDAENKLNEHLDYLSESLKRSQFPTNYRNG